MAQANKLDRQIDSVVDRIGEAGNSTAIAAYEVGTLEREQMIIVEKLTGIGSQNQANGVKPKKTRTRA
ncbi:MAG: hypothetical protein ABJH07_02635 [Sedimentitalea sp.]|uniref:hypothetical protein n=1 Tax=Rhodobacterales TaxID=204455 RepID=UPI003297022E